MAGKLRKKLGICAFEIHSFKFIINNTLVKMQKIQVLMKKLWNARDTFGHSYAWDCKLNKDTILTDRLILSNENMNLKGVTASNQSTKTCKKL